MCVPEHINLQHTDCPLGCAAGDETILDGRDMLHGLPGRFTVVRCLSCGLMRTNPRPTAESIGYYYPEDYGPYAGTKVQQNKKRVNRSLGLIKSLLQKLMDSRAAYIPQIKKGRMLEVGCASGSFMHKMAAEGWEVEGIEFSVDASEAARSLGYYVHTGTLESAPEPKQKFDLTVGWMVVEHLHDPLNCLRKLHEWAAPDGHLVFSVPNAASLEFGIFKNYWYALQLPTHLYHFTPATIAKVLSASGWRLEKVYHQRNITNLIVSFGYVLRDEGLDNLAKPFINFPRSSGKWHFILFPISWILSLFGQTGRMTIHARREQECG